MTKKHYKGIDIYYTGYNTIKKTDDCEIIYSVNTLYLQVNYAKRTYWRKQWKQILDFWWFCWWKPGVDKKIRRCLEWNSKRNQINNCVKENGYGKDYMKIKFNSDDELPLKKPLKFYATNIIIRSVFEEVGKLYPQPF